VEALSDRHWRLCVLVAEHGVLDTAQVAVLLGVSRPTAHRLLTGLCEAGLLDRWASRHGRHHRWYYHISWTGGDVLTQTLRRRGRSVPLALWERHRDSRRQHEINQFFVDLTSHAHHARSAVLHRWWHRVDACHWLREHGVTDPHCDGHGIWIEDATTVSFTLHWLAGLADPYTGEADPPAERVAACYRRSAPVDAVLVVVDTPEHENAMHHAADLTVRPIVATTMLDLLTEASPAGPVWRSGSSVASRRRLIELRVGR
jgi:hypothetical protein